MPRQRIAISDATRTRIKRAVLDAYYPQTARQVRETVGVSDQTTRATLTELVESGVLIVDRDASPIRYAPHGEPSVHEQVWRTIYRLILDRAAGDWMTTTIADELAREITESIEISGVAAGQALSDETAAREQVESRKRK